MEIGKRYIVTKDSDNGTLQVGDVIGLLTDGCLYYRHHNLTLGGWINQENVMDALEGAEYKLYQEWIDKRKVFLQEELDRLQ